MRGSKLPDEGFLKLVGQAVQAYAGVEAAEARLLKAILGVDSMQASMIFFTVQNVRSRNELLGSLLTHKYGDTHDRYWNSCSRFLQTLSVFRNAIVHWHPLVVVVIQRSPSDPPGHAEHGITNPMPGRSRRIVAGDLSPFIFDCQLIGEELRCFTEFLTDGPVDDDPTSSERFLEPIPYRNRADLQPPPKAKAEKRPRRSSQASRRKR